MMHWGKNYTGNGRFYGFCVDILESISREVGFDYLLDLVPDRKYGAQDPDTGEWNGMVAQLMTHVIITTPTPPPEKLIILVIIITCQLVGLIN